HALYAARDLLGLLDIFERAHLAMQIDDAIIHLYIDVEVGGVAVGGEGVADALGYLVVTAKHAEWIFLTGVVFFKGGSREAAEDGGVGGISPDGRVGGWEVRLGFLDRLDHVGGAGVVHEVGLFALHAPRVVKVEHVGFGAEALAAYAGVHQHIHIFAEGS